MLVSGGSHGRAPARFREALGIRGRQTVVVGLSGDSLRVRTLDSALERLQRIARRRNPDAARAVDDFIDDRRAEADVFDDLSIEIVPFDRETALLSGAYRTRTRHLAWVSATVPVWRRPGGFGSLR